MRTVISFLIATYAVITSAQVPEMSSFAIASVQLQEARKVIETRFPVQSIRDVRPSIVAGLYEAIIGNEMLFFKPDMSLFISGSLYDGTTLVNLSAERIERSSRIDVSVIPKEDAIKVVRGDGRRVMYIFTDADCAYCKRFEQTIAPLDNVTLYYLMFPLKQLHPDAERKQALIFCADDPAKAINAWFARAELPSDARAGCQSPIAKIVALGSKLGVTGTPTLFFENGSRMVGAQDINMIESRLAAAQQPQ